MIVAISPGKLRGTVAAMPSKSDLHRLLIAAYLSDSDRNALPVASEDIAATRDCLLELHAKNHVLNCRESGSTLRFLLPVAAALGKKVTFVGEGRLPDRPLAPLLGLLQAHGCALSGPRLPLTLSGQLRPGIYELPGDVSSQYVTGLLFALPLLSGESELRLRSPLESAGYVRMTLRCLERFHISIIETTTGWRIPGNQQYQAPLPPLSAEPDWSNAAFWLAANALGSAVEVTGLADALALRSAQPDRTITGLLPPPDELDASQCPDLVPIMAAVMALTPGKRRIIKASRLRLKESDRLRAITLGLNALGADVREFHDALVITGKFVLSGGTAHSFGDHRIAMALAIAALNCESDVVITGAQAVTKSYPNFWQDFRRLGGNFVQSYENGE